jgi:hypothetical protein
MAEVVPTPRELNCYLPSIFLAEKGNPIIIVEKGNPIKGSMELVPTPIKEIYISYYSYLPLSIFLVERENPIFPVEKETQGKPPMVKVVPTPIKRITSLLRILHITSRKRKSNNSCRKRKPK